MSVLLFMTVKSARSRRGIETTHQYVNGNLFTVQGRPIWPANVTIHVYIPYDPQGAGAEKEVQVACLAWKAKLQSETNANLVFECRIGQPASPIAAPPPYVIEVNWTDEETTEEPGTATPISDVKSANDSNVFERDGNVYRGQININRNRGPNNPYNSNAIYNIALREFGHIFGLDHKTADHDSEIMGGTDISDPEKKHPVKDDDVRELQDTYGRSEGSLPNSRGYLGPYAARLNAEVPSAARWLALRSSANRPTTALSKRERVCPQARTNKIKRYSGEVMEEMATIAVIARRIPGIPTT